MKTIQVNLYSFNELNELSKKVAIENYRNSQIIDLEWIIDDCSLLEPKESDLIAIFGDNYKFPLLKNNRKIYFSLDRNRYIDISQGMEIQNDKQFLQWLGLGYELISKVDFEICKDTIDFTNNLDEDFSDNENTTLGIAKEFFEQHCQDILNRIERDCDYMITDEYIIEAIEGNDYEFTECGNIY